MANRLKTTIAAAFAAAIVGWVCAGEVDLLQNPYVFTSEPDAFVQEHSHRVASFDIANSKGLVRFADSGRDAAVLVRARANVPQTKEFELSFVRSNGQSLGKHQLSISTEWEDILLPIRDFRDLNRLVFCYGKWLCRATTNLSHGFEVASVKLVDSTSGAFGDGRNHTLDEFPRATGETDDTDRFVRAVRATPWGVLTVPRGTYRISRTIKVTNGCSFELDKNARLVAVESMDVVVDLFGGHNSNIARVDYGVFFRGGVIDGNGLASCMREGGFAHLTMRDTAFLNGREFGLCVGGGYELIANNLFFKCVKSGLAGNVGILAYGGDNHYTDCIIIDYTVGFRLGRGPGANRLTRCHVWGGPLPPAKPCEEPEMLKNSICFWIESSGNILHECYADTGKTGFLVDGDDTSLLGCYYFNNPSFKLDNITVFKHRSGKLLISECGVTKTAPHYTVYEASGPGPAEWRQVAWRNMRYRGFSSEDNCPGALSYEIPKQETVK